MFEKEIVIDGRGHLFGRLASIVAAQLLRGQHVTVVRCEEILRSGSLFRNKLYWQATEHRRINTNPRRGFKHYTAPSRMFWRSLRAMLPHKTPRGAIALSKLKVFDGISNPYDRKKRVVVPDALKVLRMKSYRKFCRMGDLAKLAGWTKDDIIGRMETKRKAKSAKFHDAKVKKAAARAKAAASKDCGRFNAELKRKVKSAKFHDAKVKKA